MARPKKNVRYFICDDGTQKILTTADTIEEARARIAALAISDVEGDLVVIVGEQFEVTVTREPVVTIGAPPAKRTRRAIQNVDPVLTEPKKRGRPKKVQPANGSPQVTP
jgi:hypothetical protein